jgi:hypothetical protein
LNFKNIGTSLSMYLQVRPFALRKQRNMSGLVVDFSAITITASGLGVAVKPFILTAVVVLVLIALVHLVRLFTGWEVVVNGFVVPVWWSAPILVIFGGLAFLVRREAHH